MMRGQIPGAQSAVITMMRMKKLDIGALRRARAGPGVTSG